MRNTILVILLFAASCRNDSDKFKYDTDIASLTYKQQLKYFDNTIVNYSHLSDTGVYYLQQSVLLDKKAEEFQNKIKAGEKITSKEQEEFVSYFEGTLNRTPYVDFDILNKLKSSAIKSVSDIDILRLHFKGCFVSVLHDNKLLPFDSWSIASISRDSIKDGEEFELRVASTAFDSRKRTEWYVINDESKGFSKGNIIDTLDPNEYSEVSYRTKHYKKGNNNVAVLARLKTPSGDKVLTRTITFIVK